MTFVDTISQLEYNNNSGWWPCYRDVVFKPNDIIIQCKLPSSLPSNCNIYVRVLAPDGSGDAIQTQGYFNWYYGYASTATNTNNFNYLNLQCNLFAPEMISIGCFCLQITVYSGGTAPNFQNIVFQAYTQAYELGVSCFAIYDVAISQDNTSLSVTDCSIQATNFCGKNYNKFVSYFECVDQFTGDYYGLPTNLLGGNVPAFEFYKITWLEGSLIRQPRNIKRTIALNCTLQKTETIQTYKFICRQTLFPNYKAEEIEGMLLSDNIYLNDREFGYAGDTPFTQADKCETEYLLTMNLQDCDTYQIFNCTPDCTAIAQVFVLMSASSKYYAQNGSLVATNTDELETYFKSLSGVVNVQDVTFATVPTKYTAYKAYKIQSEGYIPNFIYSGIPIQQNKVFAQPIPISSIDLRNYGGKIDSSLTCKPATIGIIYSSDVVCDEPEIGSIWLTDPITYNLAFMNVVNGWTVDNSVSNAQVTESEVTFDLSVSNPVYNNPTTKHILVNEEIGIISNQGWPQSLVFITADMNPNLLPGSSFTIDTSGIIRYSGSTFTENVSGATIQLFGMRYNILTASIS